MVRGGGGLEDSKQKVQNPRLKRNSERIRALSGDPGKEYLRVFSQFLTISHDHRLKSQGWQWIHYSKLITC